CAKRRAIGIHKGVPSLVSYTRMLNDTQSDRKITALYLLNQFTGHGNISIILRSGLSANYFLNQTNPHPTCVCPQATAALEEPALRDGTLREDPRKGSSPGAAPVVAPASLTGNGDESRALASSLVKAYNSTGL